VCGTSIGGIIAILLGLEVPLSLIKKTFQSKKYEIFPPKGKIGKIFEALKDTVSGETTYSNAGLRSLFYELAKDRIPMEHQDQATDKIIYKDPKQLTLKDLKFPCGVLSYDLNINSVVYFTNITQECQNIKIEDAILATSAAPTYFPIHTFMCDNLEYQCIDGGIWGNDPRIFAFAFQRILSPCKIYNIITFGTGLHQDNYISRKGHEDPISWARFKPDIISTIMNASTSQVEKLFELSFRTGILRQVKLNVTLTSEITLDDSSSLPLQEKFFDNEKDDKNTEAPTNFSKSIKEAIRLTWGMGTTERDNQKNFLTQEQNFKRNPSILVINGSNRIPGKKAA